MRKFFLCLAVVSGAWIGLGAQKRADQQHLIDPESFSMILLGDPQGYVKYDINQPLFELCTAWIVDHIENLKIKAVLCTGDVVEQNENIVRNRKMLNKPVAKCGKPVRRHLPGSITRFLTSYRQVIMNMVINALKTE